MASHHTQSENSLADQICTASPEQIQEWLTKTPETATRLTVNAHELGTPSILYVRSAQELAEEYDPQALARFLFRQCSIHAQGQQSECRYTLVWTGEAGATLGTFQLRIYPRDTNSWRITGSMENVIQQTQLHLQEVMKTCMGGFSTQLKAMGQVIEIQNRAIERLTAAHESNQAALKAANELIEQQAEAQQDLFNTEKLLEVGQELVPMFMEAKKSKQ